MATSNFPVSTRIWDFLVDVINFFVFLVFGNPLSMFVMNLVSPRLTHRWAKNKTYFGPNIYAFYADLALKMPFRWAKWWIDAADATYLLDYLSTFSVKNQVAYFNKVSPTVKTFNALSSEAIIALIQQLSKEQLFALIPQARFSQNVLTYLRNAGRYDILEEYIRHGALCMAALNDFIESLKDADKFFYKQKIRFLEKYAMRYNLSSPDMNKLQLYCTPSDFERLQRANLCYEQCRKVRYFCGLVNEQEEKAWAEYCQENTLEPEAQTEMTCAQYKIFAQTGKHLAPRAIFALLQKPNEKYWQQIFNHEPKNGLICDEITDLVLASPQLRKVYLSKNPL